MRIVFFKKINLALTSLLVLLLLLIKYLVIQVQTVKSYSKYLL